jgi:Domain of unknown function (DUF4112)
MLHPKPPVTRMRQLTPGQVQRLDALRKVAQLLDSAFVVPGTSMRIGLDPIIGLVPGIGDLISPLFTAGILWQARELGIPKVVQLRMLFNVAIDTVVGLMPVLGDLFDFAWKANDMNMALLERHAHEEHRPTPGDWVFVVLMIVLLIVVAALPFVVLGWLLGALRQLF